MKKAVGGGGREMKTYGIYAIVIIAILCIFRSVGADNAFRCGTQLVSQGDTRAEVIQKCGEPTFVDSWEEDSFKGILALFGTMIPEPADMRDLERPFSSRFR
jgi:hypothetical protein